MGRAAPPNVPAPASAAALRPSLRMSAKRPPLQRRQISMTISAGWMPLATWCCCGCASGVTGNKENMLSPAIGMVRVNV